MLYKLFQVKEYERGLLYENGRFIKLLEPGVHRLILPLKRQEAVKVDVRLLSVAMPSQEILTKDRLPIRLTLIAHYRIKDPAAAINKVQNCGAFLYEEIQLALRGLVAERALEALLDAKKEIADGIMSAVRPRAEEYGMELVSCGVKDVILPGELKSIMTKVVEAEKTAQAALVHAREELAAARCQANTAKLMAENPLMLRIKELEALKELAKKSGNTFVLGQALVGVNAVK